MSAALEHRSANCCSRATSCQRLNISNNDPDAIEHDFYAKGTEPGRATEIKKVLLLSEVHESLSNRTRAPPRAANDGRS
ncbi:hypothetical protein EVAR_57338_1 [Eumeta japonica]|uniref:Uncharacterized protein n=1 Tax=Eumeta variegata TaxID=151549 RepID=A0A4C1Z7A2_EUMVA|nr:hypothetical protein EVAR_57338_1 [Eumeta japonica]